MIIFVSGDAGHPDFQSPVPFLLLCWFCKQKNAIIVLLNWFKVNYVQ